MDFSTIAVAHFEHLGSSNETAATARAKMCPSCKDEGTIACGGCDDVKYCSKECQFSDWPFHNELCASFKDFKTPPEADMIRAIWFPADGEGPKWVWLPKRLCNAKSDQELKPYLGKSKDENLKLNKAIECVRDNVTRKHAKHRIDVLINHSYNFDGSTINKSVVQFTAGRIGFGWSADILVYGGGSITGGGGHSNMDMGDVTTLCNFMTQYWNDKPLHKAGMRYKGRKIPGVTIRCKGETEKYRGEKFAATALPANSLVFELVAAGGGDSFLPDIAKRIDLPIVTVSLFPVMNHHEMGTFGYTENQIATFMHRNIDPEAPSYFLPDEDESGLGDVESHWCRNVSNVLVVRKDRKPLAPHVVEAFSDFIEYELTPLFQCVRSGEYYEGLPVTKKQLVDQITPRKWEMYLKKWKKGRGIQDDAEVYDDGYDGVDYYSDDDFA